MNHIAITHPMILVEYIVWPLSALCVYDRDTTVEAYYISGLECVYRTRSVNRSGICVSSMHHAVVMDICSQQALPIKGNMKASQFVTD